MQSKILRRQPAKSNGELRDAEIRKELTRVLLLAHAWEPDTLVLNEFGCNDARADMAVINGKMHCYEIKSRFDKLDRLANQIPVYSCIFDCVTLVVANSHLEKARALVPKWWGIMSAADRAGQVVIRALRSAKRNPSLDKKALARMLWRDEAYRLLRSNNLAKGLRTETVQKIWQAVADNLPVEEISEAVRDAIKQRGGSGFRPPLLRNGDSSPMPSNFLHSPARDQ